MTDRDCPAAHMHQPALLKRLLDAHAEKPDSQWLVASPRLIPDLYLPAFSELKAQGLVVHAGSLIKLTDHGREVAARLT